MLVPSDTNFDLSSPTSMNQTDKDVPSHDFRNCTSSDDDFDIFNSGGIMSGTGASSPFIKDEPEEFNFNSNNFPNQPSYGLQMNQNYGQGASSGIDPSELTMQNYGFPAQPALSTSWNLGNSGIGDDELLDLDLNDTSKPSHLFQNQQNILGRPGNEHQQSGNIHNFYGDQTHQSGMSSNPNQIFSHTPDGAPIQSPFTHQNFTYAHLVPHQISQHASPRMQSVSGNFENSYVNARARQMMERKTSESRSPMTPKTPALGALNIGGTPESGSAPIHANSLNQHRHQKSLSNQWDSTSPSMHSYIDSPITSPGQGHPANHAQISEILKSGKHASLPAKVDTAHHPAPTYQTQEAKRRKRRESHNMVERRRRDNINERIQELSHLVPLHRLEDEKVRKHLANNSPLSPTLAATGMSPPQATSLLAGGGRRATGAGNITMGIPMEEKDKGPNKGDILNGAVGWTRDLMWALHIKLQQESDLANLITSLGGTYPFSETEDEKRMRTELEAAIRANDVDSFEYTRGPGSGLRVPEHTTMAGDPLNMSQMGTLSPQSLSPGVHPGGSGTNSGQPQFWPHNGQGNMDFKEEEEYGMEMN